MIWEKVPAPLPLQKPQPPPSALLSTGAWALEASPLQQARVPALQEPNWPRLHEAPPPPPPAPPPPPGQAHLGLCQLSLEQLQRFRVLPLTVLKGLKLLLQLPLEHRQDRNRGAGQSQPGISW